MEYISKKVAAYGQFVLVFYMYRGLKSLNSMNNSHRYINTAIFIIILTLKKGT